MITSGLAKGRYSRKEYLPAVLLHDSLLQVLSQVHLPDIRGGVVRGDFCHIVLNHQLDELFEGGGLRVPA